MTRTIQPGWAALVVALAAVAVALPALSNGLAYDDVAIVGTDARVRSLGYLREIFTHGYWADSDQALYRPITTLSFALDWSLAPGRTAWFHLTNLLLHAGASVLVFRLLLRFFPVAAALVGGLVFAVHPVHVEAWANVVGRAELLATCFALAALLLWRPGETEPRPRRARVLGVGMLALLAVASKEGAIVLPALLLLVDFAAGELKPGLRAYARATAPGYAAVLIALGIFLAARIAVLGGVTPSAVDPVFEVARDGWPRLLTALQAWPHYLRLLLFPRTLLADYAPRVTLPVTGVTPTVLLGAILLAAAVGGGALTAFTGRRRAALALFWFPLAILPVSNLLFPIGVLVAERTLYLPSVALAIAGAGFFAALPAARPALRRAATASIAVVLALFAGRSIVRAPEWDSTDRIIAALVRDRPDSYRGEWHQARLARMRGDTARALAGYERAMQLWPWRSRLVMEAAGYAVEAGRTPWARTLADHAARSWPDRLDAHRLLAATALDMGDTASARGALLQGLVLDPDDEVLRRMRAALAPPDTTGS